MAKSDDDAAAKEAEGAPQGDEQDIQKAVDALPADEQHVFAPDAQQDNREQLANAREVELDRVHAQFDRAEALASVPQKVTDGNETAALETQTGQVPLRDTSEAPSPNELGPHHSTDPDEDPSKINDPVGDG